MASTTAKLSEVLYPDLENELRTTRLMLERFPEGNDDWKPHEKSMTLVQLASHVAEIPQYGTMVLMNDELDFAAGDHKPSRYNSRAKLLEVFDGRVAELRPAVATLSEDNVGKLWTLRNGEQVIVSRPKGELVRQIFINHLVHHRAQLGVYYRMLGVPIPGSYGPSADEPM